MLKRNFINWQEKMGLRRKLEINNETLMMLMKLKLGVLMDDLSD